jgi:FkbM family methyltransferase
MCNAFFIRKQYPLEYVRRPVRTIFDIGANIGLFSLSCIEEFGDEVEYIVAAEPSRKTFRRMQENFAQNSIPGKVILVNEAVGAVQGQGVLRMQHAPYSYSLEPAKIQHPRETQAVSVTTLDELKRRSGVERVDLLKIDVEGSELAVLQGAREVLSTARTVFVEAHSGFCRRADLERTLSPIGFVLVPWADSVERDYGDFCFIRPD